MTSGTLKLDDILDPVACSSAEADAGIKRLAELDNRIPQKLESRLYSKGFNSPGLADRILDLLGAVTPPDQLLTMLTPLLESPDTRVRTKAAKLYARVTPDWKWVDEHYAALDSREAANVIEALWDRQNSPELLDLFNHAAQAPCNRLAANGVVGLFRLGDKRADAYLRHLAHHEESNFRASAAWVIGRARYEEAIDLLKLLLQDESPKVRRNAQQAVLELQNAARR